MTTFYPPYPTSGELKAAGVVWQDQFTNEALSAANGAIIVGGATIQDGARLDGSSQYIYYDAPKFHHTKRISIVLRFIPFFEFNDNTRHFLFDGTPALEFNLIKREENNLRLTVNGSTIFASDAFAPYWKPNEENVLILSIESGDTNAWLNDVKVIDSDPSIISLFGISRFTLGANKDGSYFSKMVAKEFIVFNSTFDDLDAAMWTKGELDIDFSADKSFLTLPMTQTYVNDSGETVTPVRGRTSIRECLLGSDGKTALYMPTLLYPQGFGFNGIQYLTFRDHNDLTFSNVLGDTPFSMNILMMSGNPALTRGIISKYTSNSSGEYRLTQTAASKFQFYIVDQDNSSYFFKNSIISIIKKKLTSLTVNYNGDGPSGLNLFINQNFDPGSPGSSGTYVQMRNSSENLLLANYNSLILPDGSQIRAFQIWDKELSSQQHRIWDYLARRWRIR